MISESALLNQEGFLAFIPRDLAELLLRTDLDTLPEDARNEIDQALAEQYLAYCAQDASSFNSFVVKDKKGKPIEQARVHRTWHKLIDDLHHLIIWSHVDCGKTTQISIGRVLYEIAKNPNANIAIVQSASTEAAKTILSIAEYIERDPEFRAIAPHIVPDKHRPWNSTQLYVKRESKSRDPSIQGIGVKSPILGARLDLVIMDDVLNGENTATETERKKVIEWFETTIMGRLDPVHGRVIFIGNAWHPQDLMHHLARNSEVWKGYRFPVIDENGVVPWPEKWTPEAIDAKRLQLKDNPAAYARTMLCKARDDSDSRFKEEWIKICSRMGAGLSLYFDRKDIPEAIRERARFFTGVDFGVKRKKKSGKTVLFTGMVFPDGKKQIVDIEAGRWGGQDILNKLESVHKRYKSVLIIEANAAQQWMAEFAGAKRLPVIPFETGSNKHHEEYGVESIATELSRGEWIIPCEISGDGKFSYHPEVSDWIQQMLYYDPNTHTGDSLMASWFFREGPRIGKKKAKRTYHDFNRR